MNSAVLIDFALTGLWQSCLVALTAFGAIHVLRIHSAAARTLIWSAAFFAAAFAPLTAFAPAPITVAVPVIDAAQTAVTKTVIPAQHTGPRRVINLGDFVAPGLLLIWLSGTAYFSIRILKDYAAMGKIRREATPIKTSLGDQPIGHAELRTHKAAHGPMTTGIINPVIILPDSMMRHASKMVVENAIAHERAHIDRGDLVANLVENVILCLFWWNPCLRLMRSAIAETREMACDDRAATMASDPGAYAAALVDCAERMSKTRRGFENQTALAALGKTSALSSRVERLLSDNYTTQSRSSWSRVILAATAVTTMTICVASAAPRIEFPTRAANPSIDGPGQELVLAILDDDQSRAAALLAAGADIDAVLEGDGTPLIAAVNIGDDTLARWLISMGANVDAYARYDETALISAVRNNDDSMVRLLIDAGADVNLAATTERGDVRAPLSEARKLRQRTIANMLMGAGAQD